MSSLVADYGISSNSEESDTDVSDLILKRNKIEQSHTCEKLPAPNFDNTNASKTSVFSNPFIEEENAKQAILEKHVKMVNTKENTRVINGKKICWNYRKGRCRFGTKCQFAHDSDLQKSETELADKIKTQHNVVCENPPLPKTVQTIPETEQDYLLPLKKKKRSGMAQGLVPGKKVIKHYKVQQKKNQVHPNNESNETIPHSRSGHRIVCDDNNLYSYGGYHPQHSEEHSEGTLFRELWKFNFASKLWTLLPYKETIPAEVASSALLYDGNTIMVYGGTGIPFGIECSNRLYCCSVTNYTGMELIETKGNKPLPMYGQALVYKNGFVYTIGGTTGYNYNCEIHRLNLTTKEWNFIQPRPDDLNVPEGRYRHEIAFDGKYIYVFGGGTVVRCYNFKHIPAFNLESLTWERIETIPDKDAGYPTPRMCHGCVQRKTEKGDLEVYILGGYVKVQQSLNDFWKFEFKTRTWKLITDHPLKMPVHFNSVSITPQGKIYIFGGVYKINNQRTNDLHEAWVSIPKLSEILWEALLFYIPNISKIDKSKLHNLGIPLHFINRIDFPKTVINQNFNSAHL